jgi:hypothetical protein
MAPEKGKPYMPASQTRKMNNKNKKAAKAAAEAAAAEKELQRLLQSKAKVHAEWPPNGFKHNWYVSFAVLTAKC